MAIRILFFALFFLLVPISCDFGDINQDPTRQLGAELKELLPVALAQSARNIASIGGRVTGTVVQHLKGIDAQPEGYSQYLIDERTLDEFWRNGLYAGAMKDCRDIMEQAEREGEPYYGGIARILMAFNLGLATSCWGDVPYSQAFRGLAELQPAFDRQEEVYLSIQELLEEAITALEGPPSGEGPQEDDLVFRGDAAKWAATARALQARYHLHLSKRDPDAAQKALDAIQKGAFQTMEGQPDFPFGSSLNEANPLPLYGFERSGQLALGDFLLELMEGANDPRLSRYMARGNGIAMIFSPDSLQLYWGQFDAPIPFISLTELKFIEAEAWLLLGQPETAERNFREAVEANFLQLEIEPEEYNDFIDTHIHFRGVPGPEEQLQRLITQKYIALFAQAPVEAWVDLRRTGFPALNPPPFANPSFNPSRAIPRRYLYPVSERTSNAANLEAAIQRQGGHLLDVGLWAFE